MVRTRSYATPRHCPLRQKVMEPASRSMPQPITSPCTQDSPYGCGLTFHFLHKGVTMKRAGWER
jgi:hypothetical protein